MTTFLTILLLAISALMVLVVLVQRGRGGGLSGAFGAGGGGSSSAFGTKTGDVFTTVTVVLFVAFLLVVIWLNFRFQPDNSIPIKTTPVPSATQATTTDGVSLDPDKNLKSDPIAPGQPATTNPTSQPR